MNKITLREKYNEYSMPIICEKYYFVNETLYWNKICDLLGKNKSFDKYKSFCDIPVEDFEKFLAIYKLQKE